MLPIALALAIITMAPVDGKDSAVPLPAVIAHRGASAYLPEHTLPAKALAFGMGADYLEQDVVLTKDSVPIVLHDIQLDEVTDVAARFPDRARDDGRFYALDFSLDEIRALQVHERSDPATGMARSPSRFPVGKSRFAIPTLAEEIEFIQGLMHSTGRQVGIYPEIKSPRWHRDQGCDISPIVLKVLAEYGYTESGDRIFVQCFDQVETRRLREELGTRLPLIQLIAAPPKSGDDPHATLVTEAGVTRIAEYAQGIGPAYNRIVVSVDVNGEPVFSQLVEWAHRHDLAVHPYTFRADVLPAYSADFDGLMDLFLNCARVDGLFTDFPDRTREFVDRHVRR
ncbi:MAG: glycerophosphodiester phosphodiesterase [Planctomycetaceae bacterium]|nr:glycerophosphodiester phosphodiesterase [Planctomycetaceae bacterium]